MAWEEKGENGNFGVGGGFDELLKWNENPTIYKYSLLFSPLLCFKIQNWKDNV